MRSFIHRFLCSALGMSLASLGFLKLQSGHQDHYIVSSALFHGTAIGEVLVGSFLIWRIFEVMAVKAIVLVCAFGLVATQLHAGDCG